MGLAFGWLGSVRPTFGRIPEPALWVFDTVGLAVFIGVVGLNTGPSFVSVCGSRDRAFSWWASSSAVTPHGAALLIGRYVLNITRVILWSACAGAGTVTAAPGRFRMKPGGSCSQTEKGHNGRLGILRGHLVRI